MDNARRILRFSCLLMLLMGTVACGNVGIFDVSFSGIVDVSKLPPQVKKTVQQRWPQARISNATRILEWDSWGDYWVTLTLPDGQTSFHQITREGIVKDR